MKLQFSFEAMYLKWKAYIENHLLENTCMRSGNPHWNTNQNKF